MVRFGLIEGEKLENLAANDRTPRLVRRTLSDASGCDTNVRFRNPDRLSFVTGSRRVGTVFAPAQIAIGPQAGLRFQAPEVTVADGGLVLGKSGVDEQPFRHQILAARAGFLNHREFLTHTPTPSSQSPAARSSERLTAVRA